MTNVTDWLMIVITAVYVIATIFICRANIKSAEASKEQLEEMRKQYAEDNRPILDVEFLYERKTWYIVRFVNRGKYTAQHTMINLTQEFIDSLPEETFRNQREKLKGKECLIGAGQHYDIFIGSNNLRGNPNMKPVEGTVTYQANGQKYSDDIFVDFENYMTFFSTSTGQDDLLKAIEDNTSEIKNVGNELKHMNNKEKYRWKTGDPEVRRSVDGAESD